MMIVRSSTVRWPRGSEDGSEASCLLEEPDAPNRERHCESFGIARVMCDGVLNSTHLILAIDQMLPGGQGWHENGSV